MSMVKRGYGFGGYGYGQSKPLVSYHTSQNGDSVTTVVKEMTRMTVTEKPGYGGAAQKHGAFLEEVCEEGGAGGAYSGHAVQKHGYEHKAAYGQQHGSEAVGSGYDQYDSSTLQQHDSRASEQKHGGFVDGHKTSSYQHHGSSDSFGGGYVDDAAVQHDAAKNYTVKKHHGGYEQKAYGQQQQQHGGFGGYESYDAAGYDVDAGLLHGSTGVQKQHDYGYGGAQKATQKQHGVYSSGGGGHKGYGYVDGQKAYYQEQQQGFDADGIAGYEYDAFDMKAKKRGYSGGHKAAYQQPQACDDDGVAGYDALVRSRAMQKHGAGAAGGYADFHHGGIMAGGVQQQSYGKAYKHQVAGAGALTQYKQECESEDESDCSEEESDCEEELALAHAGHGRASGAYGYQAGKLAGGNKFGTTRQYESYHSSTTTGGYSGGGYGGWAQRKNHSLF